MDDYRKTMAKKYYRLLRRVERIKKELYGPVSGEYRVQLSELARNSLHDAQYYLCKLIEADKPRLDGEE